MQSYVNKFSIALNQDKSEVIINFYQNFPVPTSGGDFILDNVEVQVSPVSNLIMTGDCARNLRDVLEELLKDG